MSNVIFKTIIILLEFLYSSFTLFFSLIIGFFIFIFIIGIYLDVIFWILPQYKRINTLFLIQKSILVSNEPIKVNAVISFTSYRIIRKYHNKSKQKWDKYFYLELIDLLNELSKPKYFTKTFYVKTHTVIKKRLEEMEKSSRIKIISCKMSNERYLYETLKLPLKLVQFYEITFKIISNK